MYRNEGDHPVQDVMVWFFRKQSEQVKTTHPMHVSLPPLSFFHFSSCLINIRFRTPLFLSVADTARTIMAFMTKDEAGLFSCPCGYKRALKFSVQRHMTICKTVQLAAMLSDDITAVAELKTVLAAKDQLLNAADARVVELQTENEALKGENRELKKRKQAGSSVINNITNNIIVNLQPFQAFNAHWGKVQVCNNVTLPDKAFVLSCLQNPESAVPTYIEAKYFAAETPSILLPNVKKPELKVVEKGRDGVNRWVTVDKEETIERMLDTGIDELENNYSALSVKPYARWAAKEGLDADGYAKMPAYKKMKKDVEHVIISHRK